MASSEAPQGDIWVVGSSKTRCPPRVTCWGQPCGQWRVVVVGEGLENTIQQMAQYTKNIWFLFLLIVYIVYIVYTKSVWLCGWPAITSGLPNMIKRTWSPLGLFKSVSFSETVKKDCPYISEGQRDQFILERSRWLYFFSDNHMMKHFAPMFGHSCWRWLSKQGSFKSFVEFCTVFYYILLSHYMATICYHHQVHIWPYQIRSYN